MNRREFLKTLGAVLAWAMSGMSASAREEDQRQPAEKPIAETSVTEESQQWSFPLAFPAWFPVEPRVPVRKKYFVPIASNG